LGWVTARLRVAARREKLASCDLARYFWKTAHDWKMVLSGVFFSFFFLFSVFCFLFSFFFLASGRKKDSTVDRIRSVRSRGGGVRGRRLL